MRSDAIVPLVVASLIGLACLAPSAGVAKSLDAEAINSAQFSPKAKPGKGNDSVLVKAQVLLDRARFSPGLIDGRAGSNLEKAIAAFQQTNNLPGGGKLDEATWARLAETSPDPATIEYTISADDVKGPFLENVPAKMEDMVGLKRIGYSSPLELLAEKFHASEALLKELNRGKAFDEAGVVISVPNVLPAPGKPREKVARIEVQKSERALRAFDKEGKLLAFYPASIGSTEKPAPSGTFKVQAVAENPTYTYSPEFNFKGVKSDKKFEIAPGPNGPVGSVWIDLSAETYGIHGTAEPGRVGKSYSHGCVRLTNWDAKALAAMVEKGTAVEFRD
jgi:lipoprotein-anchoring transpeptidase ErfK/SrfK